ncbi:unnamed protein product [Clonostachys solani]|uniref:F-box domain-containing protein n=1 Tax=Clonostachys solani TaxID=160281 RepID=A0A9P0EPV9_9HYPO|nr:unnamed protein product [Clonostachys solani]
MNINSVLIFRESWPVSGSLEPDELYEELRRVDLFDQIICAYHSRLRQAWTGWGGFFIDGKNPQPLFLSVEAEDAAVHAYLLQALARYTRVDEEDPEADWNKFAKDFGMVVTKPGAPKHPADYRPDNRILMAQCLAVRGWCSRHEEFLRRREVQLQRGKIRALHILDLPMDVLAYMFDNFRHRSMSGLVDLGREQREAQDRELRLETIRSARLVCRAFNKLASPLLCPILHLSIDWQSIDRARKMIRNPLIRPGVRGVRLGLSYCPSELAMDESRFLLMVLKEVRDLYQYCCLVFGERDHRMVSARNGFETIHEAVTMYRETDTRNCGRRTGMRFGSPHRYDKVIRRGFQAYRDLHDEQAGLLRSGVFTSALASLLASLQRPIALNLFFNDAFRLPYAKSNGIQGAPKTKRIPDIFVNPDFLTGYLGKAHSCHFDRDMEFESAKFICELPIALEKAGALVTHFALQDMSHVRSFAPLDPRRYRPRLGPQVDWNNLSSFCGNLETFKLLSWESLSARGVKETDIHTVESYLRAMLSSTRLVDVDVNLAFLTTCRRLPPTPGHGWTPQWQMHRIQSRIFTSPWPRIRKVSIDYLATSEVELRLFCQNLGDGVIRLFMEEIEITGGSWGGILDILRGKLAARVKLKRCTVRISSLHGGEAGLVGSQQMGRIAERYVSGEVTETPWERIGPS